MTRTVTAVIGDATNVASNLDASRAGGMTGVLAVLAVLELVAVLVAPVVFNQHLLRRRRRGRRWPSAC